MLDRSQILITAITNHLDPLNNRIVRRIDWEDGKAVFEYMRDIYPTMPEDVNVVSSVNGGPVRDIHTFAPHIDDNLVFCLVPQGDGDTTSILAVVAMIAVMVVAPYIAAGLANMYGGGTFMAGAAGDYSAGAILGSQVAGSLLTVGVAMGGAMIVNAMLPRSSADTSVGGNPADESATYGWSTQGNTALEGKTWPVLYGTMRVFPYLIGRYISSSDNKQYLNMLFGVADHAVDSIGDIEINENASSQYTDINIDTSKKGSLSQTPIANFNDTYTESSVWQPLAYGSWKQDTATGNATQGLVVGITLPNGLCYFADNGSLSNASVSVQIQYRPTSGGAWTNIATDTITDKTQKAIRKEYRVDNLTADEYEIQACLTADPPSTNRYSNTIYLDYVQSVIYDDFAYPGASLLGVEALATDQLSGSMPRISCLVTRNNVDVYVPGTGWTTKPSNNPAWACYDMHVNAEYGAAIPYSRMNYSEFSDWADFCTTNNYTVNMYFDTAMSFSQAVNILSTMGRGTVVQKGTKFGVVIDKADDPVQMFGMGNIVTNSYKETFLDTKDRANCIEITYFDAAKNYTRQTFELRSSSFDTDADITENKISIVLYACTSKTLALKHAKFLLNCNEYLTRTISFEVGVDALASNVGDVIYFSHDVPQWGYSGRITGATSTTVNLDRFVTLESGTSYQVVVRHYDDDDLEFASISFTAPDWVTATAYKEGESVKNGGNSYTSKSDHTSAASSEPGVGGSWTTYWTLDNTEITIKDLTLSGVWSQTPQADDIYSFGVTNSVVKEFRIIGITRTQDQNRKIMALEYDANVYSDTATIEDYETDYDLPFVTDLRVQEIWAVEGDLPTTFVNLSWRGFGVHTIYQKESTEDIWRAIDTITGKNDYDVYNLEPGKTYYFAVSSTSNWEDGESDSITFDGPAGTVPSVQNITHSEEVYAYRERSFTRWKVKFDPPTYGDYFFWSHAEIWQMIIDMNTIANDETSNANHGTIEGSPTIEDGVWGVWGKCLEFNGTTQRVDCGDGGTTDLADLGNGDFSISFWMDSTSIQSDGCMFSKYVGVNDHILIRSNGTSNELEVALADGVNSVVGTFTDLTPFDSSWHHVVVVVNRTDDKIYAYIDKTISATEPDISSIDADASNAGNVSWGAQDDGSSPYAGKLDECRIYNRALTQANVEALYELEDLQTDLIGYWPFSLWRFVTKATKDYTFDPVEEGTVHYCKIRSVSSHGVKEDFDAAQTVSKTIIGKLAPPSNLSSMTAVANGDSVSIYADPVTDPDIEGYEVRLGDAWDGAIFISLNKNCSLRLNGVRPGTHTFWMSPKDNSGNYSATPVSATVTVFIPPGFSELATYGSWAWDFNTGTHSNTEHTTYDSGDALKCSHTASVLTGTFTSPVHDLNAIKKVRIWGDFRTAFVSTDTTWDGVAPVDVDETIDNAAAVDKGGGKVGIPITDHNFSATDGIMLSGTTNYDGENTVDSETANEVVITATYVAETFAGTERAFSSEDGATWDDLLASVKTWNQIFEPEEAGQVKATLYYSESSSTPGVGTWGSVDFFEILCAEVSARYVYVEVEITDPTVDTNIYLKELNMKAYEGPQ